MLRIKATRNTKCVSLNFYENFRLTYQLDTTKKMLKKCESYIHVLFTVLCFSLTCNSNDAYLIINLVIVSLQWPRVYSCLFLWVCAYVSLFLISYFLIPIGCNWFTCFIWNEKIEKITMKNLYLVFAYLNVSRIWNFLRHSWRHLPSKVTNKKRNWN